MITQLLGLAVDARALARDPEVARAHAARWIAANLVAIRGLRVPPGVAAIGRSPALLDPRTLPLRWRLGLRVIGMPFAEGGGARRLAA